MIYMETSEIRSLSERKGTGTDSDMSWGLIVSEREIQGHRGTVVSILHSS